MPRFRPPSDTPSSTIPPSCIDDGRDIQSRMPLQPSPPSHPLKHPFDLQKWLDGDTQSSVTAETKTSASTFTGSYVDDGADMFLPCSNAPMMGKVNESFYTKNRRSDPRDHMEWSEELQRAVSGEIQRSVEEMRRRENLRIVDAVGLEEREETARVGKKVHWEGDEEHEDTEEEHPSTVKITVPRSFGTFVISGEDGRVVVVDRLGEFDSGVPGDRHNREEEDGREDHDRAKEEDREKNRVEEKAKRKEKKRKKHGRRTSTSPPAKPLSIVLEHGDSEDGTDAPSPTRLYMPDVAKIWASPQRSHVEAPPVPNSPTCSPPGAWPSPLLSPTKAPIQSPTKPSEPWTHGQHDGWIAPASPVDQASSLGSGSTWDNDAAERIEGNSWTHQSSPVRQALSVGSAGTWHEGISTVLHCGPPAAVTSLGRSREFPISTSSAAVPASWNETGDWNQDPRRGATSLIKQSSSKASSKRSNKSSAAVIPEVWTEAGLSGAEPKVKTISSSTGHLTVLDNHSEESWVRDVEAFESRVPHKMASLKAASVGSSRTETSWGGEEGEWSTHVGQRSAVAKKSSSGNIGNRSTHSARNSAGSRGSSTASKTSWARNARLDDRTRHSSLPSDRSRTSTISKDKTPWGVDAGVYRHSDSSCTTAIHRSKPPSITGSQSTWDKPSYTQPSWGRASDTQSVHSTSSNQNANEPEPYSWRRESDEDSTYSNAGSHTTHVLLDAGSKLLFQDKDEDDEVKMERPAAGDRARARSRSTGSNYRAPFVEDIFETPMHEKKEYGSRKPSKGKIGSDGSGSKKGSNHGWNTHTVKSMSSRGSSRGTRGTWEGSKQESDSGWGSQKSDRSKNVGATTSWGGSANGSETETGRENVGGSQDRSGFGEDNTTWLSAETPEGVNCRQSEWEWSTTRTVKDV